MAPDLLLAKAMEEVISCLQATFREGMYTKCKRLSGL
jgi:hypothetical protein